MDQCALFWLAITLFAMVIALIVIASIALHRLGENKEFWERVRSDLGAHDVMLKKLLAAVEWRLGQDGFKLDYMSWKWYVTPTACNFRTTREMERDRREELARALYEANINAMRDFDKEKKKEAKKK